MPPLATHPQVWIAPGLGLGDDFIATLSSLSDDSSVVMLAILLVFAVAHSGLAFLRPYGARGQRLLPLPLCCWPSCLWLGVQPRLPALRCCAAAAPLLPAMHVGQHSAGTAWRTSIE